MSRPRATIDDGRLDVSAATWSLAQPRSDRPFLRLGDADGQVWADIAPIAAADTLEGPDEWLQVGEPSLEDVEGTQVLAVRWEVRSLRWHAARLVLRAEATRLAFRLEVEGTGSLTDVRLLGGRGSAWPRMGTGRWWTGRRFGWLVPGSPGDPRVIAAPAGMPAAVAVAAGAQPGRARWFYTPGPFAFAASRAGDEPWLGIGLELDGIEQASFTQLTWETDDDGFDLRLDYEGHTGVDGTWASPWVVLSPGLPDAYAALAASAPRADAMPSTPASAPDLAPAPVSATAPAAAAASAPAPATGSGVPSEPGVAAVPAPVPSPSWWLEPMFCGWGAQVAVALDEGTLPAAESTQARYDVWLARLAAHGAVPGTVVVDDKWQRTYGVNEPDETRWPDLAGWIELRHAAGQQVLLWWKAWDAEGLPDEWCVRDADDRPICADPTNPAYAAFLEAAIGRLLRCCDDGGLGADGLKIDFTGAAPSGGGLRTWAELHGEPDRPWGFALLHRLLAIVAAAARRERPDALIVTHTPNLLFRDVLSMVRLNDALRLDDPDPLVPVIDQLRHRASIVRAALPGVPVDTDDWAMPSRAEWRAWQAAKPAVGVPALYHVDGLGTTDERLTNEDLSLVAATWAAYRDRLGLQPRG